MTQLSQTSPPSLLSFFGSPLERVERSLNSLKNGKGIIVLDDEDRENEGDLIWSAQTITPKQMAFTIRYGSGIVCLCLTKEKCDVLQLPMMVQNNTSQNGTGFTISIEAAKGVTTGVSARDRVTTIQAAIAPSAKPSDLHHPGHVFPLLAKKGGVLERRGHTEASVDLVALAGFSPEAVICELTNDDGTMMRTPEIIEFAKKFDLPVLTIEDLVAYIKNNQKNQ